MRNDKDTGYPDKILAQDLFLAQVEQAPAQIALLTEGESLTYGALHERANRLAHHLQALGVGPEVLVGVLAKNSLDAVVSILAVLQAGGAYVPLDPAYPRERLSLLLADTKVPVLVVIEERFLSALPEHKARLVCLERDRARIDQKPSHAPSCQEQALVWPVRELHSVARAGESGPSAALSLLDDAKAAVANARQDALRAGPDSHRLARSGALEQAQLAYVIYTSGSSGRPKGVMVEHRSLCNLAEAERDAFGITKESRVLQFASLCFDVSVFEIFSTLFAGATLCIASPASLRSGPALLAQLRAQKISVACLPPSLLAALPSDDLPSLRTIITGGEVCSTQTVARWSRGRRFFNAYGPTEATVGATIAEFTEGSDPSCIGAPLANTRVYLLDERLSKDPVEPGRVAREGDRSARSERQRGSTEWAIPPLRGPGQGDTSSTASEKLQPVPAGVAGEIYIGGVGVARGYLNRPELTRERFLPDPFSQTPGARMYKTGDLAKFSPDGSLLFVGRADQQVKLRGFRIELGEIEAALARHPGLKEAVVLLREDNPGEKRLVAYSVPLSERDPPPLEELRGFLQKTLPGYMIPSVFVSLASFPLTPNKKIDRRALPTPPRPGATEGFAPPETPREEEVAALFSEILGHAPVGRHDDFFALGGDSLLATRLLLRLESALGLRLSPEDLWQRPTVAKIARLLDEGSPAQPDFLLEEEILLEKEIAPVTAPSRTVDGAGPVASLPAVLADANAARGGGPLAPPALSIRLNSAVTPAVRVEAENILLTGATGFLGAFLLKTLLQRTSARVYCLVRASSVEEAKERLRENFCRRTGEAELPIHRVTTVRGDLSLPRFGLKRPVFQELAEEIDLIYHNGAQVDMLRPYPALRPANVFGTKEILRFACLGRTKPVHYVSTIGVFLAAEQREDCSMLTDGSCPAPPHRAHSLRSLRAMGKKLRPPISQPQTLLQREDEGFGEEDRLTEPQRLLDGYTQSKWVAEQLLGEARARGLPVAVYRPSTISGHSLTGACHTADFFCRMLKGCIELGCAPEEGFWWNLAPVDYVSEAIWRLSLRQEGGVFHLVNPETISMQQVVEHLGALGYPLRVVSYEEWWGRLRHAAEGSAEGNALSPVVHALREGRGRREGFFRFRAERAARGLQGVSLVCPPPDAALFARYLSYFVSSGFLLP